VDTVANWAQRLHPAQHQPAGEPVLVLVPLGEVAPELLGALAARLGELLAAQVQVGAPLPVPASGLHPRRGQYLAPDLLRLLRQYLPAQADLALGVTELDLYAPRLNFVFGQAELGGKVGVISLARLRPGWYRQPPDPELLLLRALKEAVHELGHLRGAEHCPRPTCVMHFSHALADTDHKDYRPCPRCQAYYPLRRPGG